MPATQVNSSTLHPDIAPTLIPFALNGVSLQWWVHKDHERGLIQVMVKRSSDRRPWNQCERYPVFTITAQGECYRNSGLPTDWGFRLTAERKIKEVM